MKRRKSLKIMALGALTPGISIISSPLGAHKNYIEKNTSLYFESDWDLWPDMDWVGPEYWGNRLQDWKIQNGKVLCQVSGPNRTLHCLTTQATKDKGSLETSIDIEPNQSLPVSDENYIGLRLGIKGRFDDYRSAAVHGKGIDIAVTTSGKLKIGNKLLPLPTQIKDKFTLQVKTSSHNSHPSITVELKTLSGESIHTSTEKEAFTNESISGNIALVAHIKEGSKEIQETTASATFANWKISGSKLISSSEHEFGPICFAQYTLHKGILKLTGQLTPVEQIAGHKVSFEIKEDGKWKELAQSEVEPMSRTVHFRQENWNYNESVPYRIQLQLPLKSKVSEEGSALRYYTYEGSISKEPIDKDDVKTAVFSCNCDYGFPDSEVPVHVACHEPDLALFVGDQFYEGTGGFGIQTSPIDKAALDYLRKWMMFGWSYREVFRHIPCAIIPDDHDVYHGNIWGEAGKAADISGSWGAPAQDSGGYKMAPKWVNMVQKCQTSHLPDPYDPTPVKRGIDVYYTEWIYGGVSFAILEDRKWKSAPKHVLPEEAEVWNGWIQNPDFDIKKHRVEDAQLLGERQLSFLDHWSQDWSGDVKMKSLVTQTNFSTVSTLPADAKNDGVVPGLKIPVAGEYVSGDVINGDMDSNGWPQVGRDKAVAKIRKCFAFHIAGDQHLASFIQYGVEEYGDSGYAFAGPALNNIWPRRWWPPVANPENHSESNPAYTGNYEDGFGNKMTIKAVANPRLTGKKPAIVYDRATGYGIVTFNKTNRTITTECWPKYVHPLKNPEGQYAGWPITVDQQDNYGRKAAAWLPEIKVNGLSNPVVEVIEENSGESLYYMAIKGNTFTPKVFSKGTYTIKVKDSTTGKTIEKNGIKASSKSKGTLMFSI
ncbi:twin-arginine translocation pathway signal protein [Echinicola salinicaeni]|uniref:twin-arginine translocation pathway signal protein n=1 Tax=Echinicola salinicaeni TaxID=2762757 RepID=UPI0016473884|nr:twin-arginine translocation pathway signal protein [Echinicola salinicaeni]